LAFEPKSVKTVFDCVDREVWIVTAADNMAAHKQNRGGMVATFVNQASIVPHMPRVMAGVAKTHETCALIEGSAAFALHLIDESQLDLVWRFGLQSSRDADKFADVDNTTTVTGSPLLGDAVAWLDCRVESRFDIGDRIVFLAEVVDGKRLRDARPLSLRRLIELAPKEKLATLREQMEADAARDAEAIGRWRQERSAT
jgi:flavin reductase (DIM6/NTAB) family NADH-FMN oxidoreductase RutF